MLKNNLSYFPEKLSRMVNINGKFSTLKKILVSEGLDKLLLKKLPQQNPKTRNTPDDY